MKVQLNKFIVQAVLLHVDDDGNVTGEQISEPQPIYGVNKLLGFVEELKKEIETANNPPQEE